MRRLVALLALLALAAGCGSSSKQSAPRTTAARPATTSAPTPPTEPPQPVDTLQHNAGKVKVTITAPTHRPKVNAPWRYTVLVTAAGKPQPARIYLQVTFRKQVVGNIGTHLVTKGRWAETIRWPAASKGHPLAFEAKAISNGRVGGAAFPIRVR
jgi:hypothetical protein